MTVNQEIQAPYVEVKIWPGDNDSDKLGQMSLAQALAKARSFGKDLVQSSKEPIPVCYIRDYGQSLYKVIKRTITKDNSAEIRQF